MKLCHRPCAKKRPLAATFTPRWADDLTQSSQQTVQTEHRTQDSWDSLTFCLFSGKELHEKIDTTQSVQVYSSCLA